MTAALALVWLVSCANEAVGTIPSEWIHGVDVADILFGPRPTIAGLMPSIGNGEVGWTVGSPALYAAGLYCKTTHAVVFEGSQRCTIPTPRALGVLASGPVTRNGVALDVRGGRVMERLTLNDAPKVAITQTWYAHRTRPSLVIVEIVVDNRQNSALVTVPLTVMSAPKSPDLAFAPAPAPTGAEATYGAGATEHGGTKALTVAVVSTIPPANMTAAPGQMETLRLVIAVRSTAAVGVSDPLASATQDWKQALVAGDGMLSEHTAGWAELWDSGIEVEGDLKLAQQINASLYALLSSSRADAPWPMGPGGLPTNGYWGNAFWDQDMWMMPTLIPFWPELAAAGVDYRVAPQRVAAAQNYSKSEGFQGAFVPWQTASTGVPVDLAPPFNLMEQHTGAGVSLLVKRLYDATADADLLRRAADLIYGIADFYCGRAVSVNGKWSLRNVVGPDEYALGFPLPTTGVYDEVYTNAAAALAAQFAGRVAVALGHASDPSFAIRFASWKKLHDEIYIISEGAGDTEWHPEYTNYPSANTYSGKKVKQADVTMLAFPLEWPVSPASVRNDLLHYASVYDPEGPAMTESISAINWLAIDEPAHATEQFQQSTIHMHPPFQVWTESKDPDQKPSAKDMGCYNFLTGAGGFIQSLLYGYGGVRIRPDGFFLRPQRPQGVSKLVLKSIKYMGGAFRLESTVDVTRVCLDKAAKVALSVGRVGSAAQPFRGCIDFEGESVDELQVSPLAASVVLNEVSTKWPLFV